MGALQGSVGQSPLSCSGSCFWIATKDNLTKLKLMVVYLNMTGCELLWFIISEATEQPQQLAGNQQEQGEAGQAQSLWHRRWRPEAGRTAGTATLFWGSTCFLGPFTLHYIPTFGYCWREGMEIDGPLVHTALLKFLLPTLSNMTSDHDSGMSKVLWKDVEHSVITQTESPSLLAASGWHNETTCRFSEGLSAILDCFAPWLTLWYRNTYFAEHFST